MERANIEGVRPHQFIDRLHHFRKELKPRPNSGFFYKDVIYLIMIGFLQNTIIPTLMPWGLTIDLITPWLVITAIRQHALPATILAFLAAFILELNSTIPSGIYIVTYWITVNLIVQVRLALSWRHQIPWTVSYLMAGLWVHAFESVVVFMSQGMEGITLVFLAQQVFKIFTAVCFGMLLCQEWLKFDAEEPVPQ